MHVGVIRVANYISPSVASFVARQSRPPTLRLASDALDGPEVPTTHVNGPAFRQPERGSSDLGEGLRSC